MKWNTSNLRCWIGKSVPHILIVSSLALCDIIGPGFLLPRPITWKFSFYLGHTWCIIVP
jgi:hypothetical protein